MLLAIGSDHVGFMYKKEIISFFNEEKIQVIDLGCNSTDRTDYPVYGNLVAKAVASHQVSLGILVCGTGVGMSLVANSVQGVRAVVCSDPYTARLSREHNDTNILAIGSRVVGIELAKMIITSWLNSMFLHGIYEERLKMFKN